MSGVDNSCVEEKGSICKKIAEMTCSIRDFLPTAASSPCLVSPYTHGKGKINIFSFFLGGGGVAKELGDFERQYGLQRGRWPCIYRDVSLK